MKLTKEDLKNTKIRVPTTEIKDEVVKKLEKLGINVCVKDDDVKHYYIADNEAGWTGGYSESYYSCHEYKEIPYTDLLEDESPKFKDWAELYQWASELKPIYFMGVVCYYTDGKCSLNFGDSIERYTKHIDPPKPKEIVLNRYTFESGGSYRQTIWVTDKYRIKQDPHETLVKTETKTVKLGE